MTQRLRCRAEENTLLQAKVWKGFFFFFAFYLMPIFTFSLLRRGCVCMSIFALCVDSDHRGYKFHTNIDGLLPAWLFPVFILTFFSAWNL